MKLLDRYFRAVEKVVINHSQPCPWVREGDVIILRECQNPGTFVCSKVISQTEFELRPIKWWEKLRHWFRKKLNRIGIYNV
jgi:hypothetical protein